MDNLKEYVNNNTLVNLIDMLKFIAQNPNVVIRADGVGYGETSKEYKFLIFQSFEPARETGYSFSLYIKKRDTSSIDKKKAYIVTLYNSDDHKLDSMVITERELLSLTGVLFKSRINLNIFYMKYEALAEIFRDYANFLGLSNDYENKDEEYENEN